MSAQALILAAGHGTRMQSAVPKMLHPLLGRPILQWVIDACVEATGGQVTVVVGPRDEGVQQGVQGDVQFVVQEKRLGTAHATAQAKEALVGADPVLVVNGDLALLQAESLRELIARHEGHSGAFSLLAATSDNPRGFGRLVRDERGALVRIQEAAHATEKELMIRELNVGAYCFGAEWLWRSLPQLEVSPKGEYYLTDLLALAVENGERVATSEVMDPTESVGINNRLHLAEAEAILRGRVNREWMLAGVTMQDPNSIYIESEVRLAPDVVLLANTHLHGETVVGEGSHIGPNTVVRRSTIGRGCRIRSSVLEGAVLEDKVDVGPFSHLRDGAHLERGVHIGNYGEVKNSRLGRGVKMGHFSYMGDASVGENANIGAGTITCNYDGEKKHRTEIGEGAFIGSDTMLVAPVRIGRGARTGAGSVVTKDVPDSSVAVGVPARVIRKLKADDE